jgi:hypothetical protein
MPAALRSVCSSADTTAGGQFSLRGGEFSAEVADTVLSLGEQEVR